MTIQPTAADREAAAQLIETYWQGNGDAHDGMRKLAQSYRDGMTQGVWAQAFARHAQQAREEILDAWFVAIASGYPEPARKVDQCDHGKFGWEDCINCYDAAMESRIAALSTKGQDDG